MKTIYFILAYFLLSVTLSAKDGDFVVSNSYVVFEASNNAPSSTLSFENKSSDDISVGSLSLIGAHSDEFNITSDGCTATTLSANGSCNVEVKFIPKNRGTKNALLEIPYDRNKLYVFLTNHEDNGHNVRKRLVPVVYDVNISEKLNGDTAYTFKWSLIGYHKNYQAQVVMFDCTDVAVGQCGASYSSSEKFVESRLLSATSFESVNWRYHDQNATRFNYTFTTTLPAKRANNSDWSANGTDIVVRFYVLADEDQADNEPSLSLIIPGNLASRYYDTSGRKIEKTMCPKSGCSE